jgi:hypothetical protein
MLDCIAKPKDATSKAMEMHFEKVGATSDLIDQHPAI